MLVLVKVFGASVLLWLYLNYDMSLIVTKLAWKVYRVILKDYTHLVADSELQVSDAVTDGAIRACQSFLSKFAIMVISK